MTGGQSLARIRPMAPDEAPHINAMIDRVMRPGGDLSCVDDLPLLVGEGSRSIRMVVEDRGEVVAHGAGRVLAHPLPGGGVLPMLNIGAVCTDPKARGLGHARALVERLGAEGATRGAPITVLWSQTPEFYGRMGFTDVGREAQFTVTSARLARVPFVDTWPVRHRDLAILEQLRAADATPGAVRDRAAARALFSLPRSKTWIAFHDRRPAAYGTVGKGIDLQGILHEWAGPGDMLPPLARAILEDLGHDELAIIGPAWRDDYIFAFEELGARRADGPVALAKLIDPAPILAAGLPTDLPELLGAPDGPAGVVPFYLWGLDSM